MDTIISLIVLIVIVALAAGYVYRVKKRGNKCIGCPYGSACVSKTCCSRENVTDK